LWPGNSGGNLNEAFDRGIVGTGFIFGSSGVPRGGAFGSDLAALIESDKLLADDLRAVEYDRRVSIVGEAYRLFNGNYPGF
jgi:hypothetical protein